MTRGRRSDGAAAWLPRVALLPELNILAFAFLLHFPLELWIIEPRLPADPHALQRGEVTALCAAAAAAHALIALLAYWVVASSGRRAWTQRPHWAETLIFTLCAGVFTLLAEPGLGLLLEDASPHADTFAGGWGGGMVPASLFQAFVVPWLLVRVLGRQLQRPANVGSAASSVATPGPQRDSEGISG